jgi:hypothetical protein
MAPGRTSASFRSVEGPCVRTPACRTAGVEVRRQSLQLHAGVKLIRIVIVCQHVGNVLQHGETDTITAAEHRPECDWF